MKKLILEYLGLIFACFLTSVAFVFFISPYKLVPGGVYGTSIVLHNLFPALQVGTFGYMISIPLLLLSYFFLGKHMGVRTLVVSLLTPFLMNVISRWAYPSEEALQMLDPTQIAGGNMNFTNDLLLSVIIGATLIAFGESIMIRCKATSGGSDVVAMLIHKYFRVRFSRALMFVDGTVVLVGLVVIGFGIGTEDVPDNGWLLSCYSLICIFLLSNMMAYFLSGAKSNKLVFVITDGHADELKDLINNKLDLTATIIPSTGMYSGMNKSTLMMCVKLKRVDDITATIGEIDPSAFVIVTDAYDTFGYRWKKLPGKNSLQLS